MGMQQREKERAAKAKAEIRAMKKTVPHIFPQWQELQRAKAAAREANARLARAKAAWEALGKDLT